MQSKPEVCFPGTCIGNTDSRHFTNVTNAIYRFNPLLLKSDDLPRYCILAACGQLFGVGTKRKSICVRQKKETQPCIPWRGGGVASHSVRPPISCRFGCCTNRGW